MRDDIEYKEALARFLKEGYRILGGGPESVTLQDPRIDIKVDLYRRSIAAQLLHMLKPSFTKEFTKLFIEHLTRETY